MEKNSGYIYIAVCPAMPNLLKIGKTKKHPIERMMELSAPSGIPTPFQLAYYQPCNDMDFIEKKIHDFLKNKRAKDNREFFAVSLFKAATTLDGIIGTYSKLNPSTPFAELFATFDDRGDGKLNEKEIAQCNELKVKLAENG